MNIALFYRYYLKKLFKSWYFWVFTVLGLLFVVGFPLFLYKFAENKTYYSITNYKDFVKWFAGLKNFKGKHSSGGFTNEFSSGGRPQMGEFGPFPYIFKDFMLAGGSNYKDILTVIWKLTCWGLTGIMITEFLVVPAISFLVSKSQNNGDDETALTLVSPIKRDDLIIGKLLAFLTLFLVCISLTFIIPYAIYYCWLAESISWSVLITFLLGSLIFVIPIFLLFYAVLFLLDSLSPWLRWIFGFFIGLASYLWLSVKYGSLFIKMDEKTIESLTKFGSNFWIIVPLALVIGGLFLFLYRERFRKKDF